MLAIGISLLSGKESFDGFVDFRFVNTFAGVDIIFENLEVSGLVGGIGGWSERQLPEPQRP